MRRRRRGGCLRQILIVVVIGGPLLGLGYSLEVFVYAPWAYGLFGRQALTGVWDGTLRTLGGTPYAIRLEVTRSSLALTSPNSPDIDGHLSWCAPGHPSTTASLDGRVNHSASNIRLDVKLPGHPLPGLVPSEFTGAWHGSTLSLHVLFTQYDGHRYTYSTAIPDEETPVRLTLRKAASGAYQAACAHL